MPNFIRKALNYLDEGTKWMLAGQPVVSPEVRAFRRKQCDACEQRDKEKDACKLCGCPLYPTKLGDKLSWATSDCPYKDQAGKPAPKWLPLVSADTSAIELAGAEVPSWRRVVIWISNDGKPDYVDGLTLTPDDVVLLEAWIDNSPDMGYGIARRWEYVRDLPANGSIRLVSDFVHHKLDDKSEACTVHHALVTFEDGKAVRIAEAG